MKFIIKASKSALSILLLGMAVTSCQKMTQPALGNYPKDANLPGGPLKFFTAFDGTNANKSMASVDSIKANFGVVNGGSFVSGGVEGNCFQGSPTSFVQYPSANDFASVTSFTVSFWVKKTPQAAGLGTNFAFSLNSGGYSWTNIELFLEFEDAGNPSTVDSAACKFYILDQWFEFIKNSSKDTRMPKVLNGQWHHLAFTYDETNSKLYTYIDGALFQGTRSDVTDVTNNGAPRGKLAFTNINGLTIGGPSKVANTANSWMGNFDGSIDQFRLYGKALSAAEVAALYNGKM